MMRIIDRALEAQHQEEEGGTSCMLHLLDQDILQHEHASLTSLLE